MCRLPLVAGSGTPAAMTWYGYGSPMPEFSVDESGEDEGPGVGIVEDRPPLREGRVFVDYDERATIAENLEAASSALDQAFRR